MTKITVWDAPYVGHNATVKHEYSLSECIETILYSKDAKSVTIRFNSCSGVLKIPVDDLQMIAISND